MQKNMQKKTLTTRPASILLAFLLLLLPLVGTVETAEAQVDMSRYVAIGDSLGAGFISGGLLGDVQRYSYPALVYENANGSLDGFALPTVTAPGVPPVLQLVGLNPTLIVPAAGFGEADNLFFPGLYGNLCVPGADMNDLVNTRSGGLNDLILRGLGTQLELALAQQPTVVSLWVNNDVLGAAVSGVVIDGVTLTRTADFEANLRAAAGAIVGSGAQLILGTVAPTTAIPYVTTIPPVVVNPATNQPVLIDGAPVPLLGPNGPLAPGQDFVLLGGTAELAAGFGIPAELGGRGEPLSTFAVLTADEVAAIAARTTEFNDVIRAVAADTGAAVVDYNAEVLRVAAEGLDIGGINFTGDFLTGGLFSTDAVHGTPLGYAWLANTMIDEINDHFGNDIPPVSYAPYIFGGRNSLGTSLPVGVPGASSIVMTPKAAAHLMEVLDVPSKKKLRRIMNRRAARAAARN